MPNSLTDRQRQCLALSSTLHDQQIADSLGISVHTVRQHISEAKVRLGVNDRKAARRLLPQVEGEEFEGIGADADSALSASVATVFEAGPTTRVGADSHGLIRAYASLGQWRTPPRWRGKRIGPIVVTALLLVVLLGLVSQSLRSCVEFVDMARGRPLEHNGGPRAQP